MTNRVLYLLVGTFLVSCSLRPVVPNIRVNVSVEESRFRESVVDSARGGSAFKPTSAATFQCYFVSIKGEGISSKFTQAQLFGLDPGCTDLQLGETSRLKTSAELLAGVQISVPAGRNRTIRVFGVNSNTGSDCSGKTLPEVFGSNHWGSIFEVGMVTQDLLVGQDVNMGTTTYNLTRLDLAANCSKRAVLPLVAAYQGGPQGPTVSVANLPPSYSVFNLLAIDKGSNLSFPIIKTTSSPVQALHFLFVAPQGSKATSIYNQVLFISNSTSAGTFAKSGAACRSNIGDGEFLHSSSTVTSVHYESTVSSNSNSHTGGSFHLTARNSTSGLDDTLNDLLINNINGDLVNPVLGVGTGSYVHLTLFSPINTDGTLCPALNVGDVMAVAVEP